jgi:hypothetical protein
MNPSSDIEISDVTLPTAALRITSVFEELDGFRIELIVRRLAASKSRELATPNGASEPGRSRAPNCPG